VAVNTFSHTMAHSLIKEYSMLVSLMAVTNLVIRLYSNGWKSNECCFSDKTKINALLDFPFFGGENPYNDVPPVFK